MLNFLAHVLKGYYKGTDCCKNFIEHLWNKICEEFL